MTKQFEILFENETLSLSKDQRGFSLYDSTRGMNLAMNEKTERDAMIKCIMYYQERLSKVETEHNAMKKRLHSFMQGEGWKEIDQSDEDFITSYK